MATQFAAEGANIVAADCNAQRLERVVADVRDSGGTIVGSQGNFADQATAEGLIDLAISTYGGELSDDIWRCSSHRTSPATSTAQ